MVRRQFGAKPLSTPVMIPHQSRPKEPISEKKMIETDQFLIKMHLKLSSVILLPFCPMGDELSLWG